MCSPNRLVEQINVPAVGHESDLWNYNRWIAVQPILDSNFVIAFQRSDKSYDLVNCTKKERQQWGNCMDCQPFYPRFANNTEQEIFSRLMAVLPISGLSNNDSTDQPISSYLLVFNISGRPMFCFSSETALSEINSTEEVLLQMSLSYNYVILSFFSASPQTL